jgi:para-aminobenzoate synthetase / 4-amino-4-deoxychorismate lyase
MNLIERAATTPNSVLLVTSRPAHESRKSYFFTDPVDTFTVHSLDDLPALFDRIDAAPAQNLHAAGYIGYECGYANEQRLLPLAPIEESSTPLAWFGFYRDPVVFDYVQETPPQVSVAEPTLDISQRDYFCKFTKIKEHIQAGNTYQVNLTTRLKWENTVTPAALFAHIMAVQPVEFGALVNMNSVTILSASPELFFRRNGNQIITRPMKGTAPRGFSIAEEKVNAKWLANDEKNRSENVMIVDLLRNDLRRICTVDTVNVDTLFAIETYPTLLQMTSTVSGNLRPGITYREIFRALFPCGSITGAPKVRTMEIIRELEEHPRGVYTGSIGFISPEEKAVFNVAIRSLVLKDGRGEMGIGGGIVWDSDAADEFEECRLKGSFLGRSSTPFDLIETMLWDAGFMLLERHIERLISSAEYFGFPCDPIEVQVRLRAATKSLPSGQHRVRLLLSRRGEITITSQPITQQNDPLTAIISTQSTNPNDMYLRHKTTRRDVYDDAFKEAQSLDYDDAIFLNIHGNLTEGAIHNIFIVKSGQWFTPPLSDGVLHGVLRAEMFDTHSIMEKSMDVGDIKAADEVYLGNSVRGLRQVRRVDVEGGQSIWERKYSDSEPYRKR